MCFSSSALSLIIHSANHKERCAITEHVRYDDSYLQATQIPAFMKSKRAWYIISMHVCDISVERIYLHVHGRAKVHLTLESSNSQQISGKVPTVASECGIQPIYTVSR